MLNLDTHVLVYALTGELTSKEVTLLSNDTWSISAIVLWEISKLAQLGRIEVDLDDAELTRVLSRVHTWPITLEICREIRHLDFRCDPADELIAATSLVHRVPLVTRDRTIKKSRKVPLAG
ncbi:MAG TPA: type II toxin-antitoxin system VapC family toxin [Candidatus Acidoferrales bacterium]|nr:type II toxin-antitoxin system VapC family toxin [Candidatus Acidoferrales bacterium]